APPAATTFADVFAEYQGARALAERTKTHERHLFDRHLAEFTNRRVQAITASDVARVIRSLRERYSAWTVVAVVRILRGTFALAVGRGTVTRSPMDGLAASEGPKQRSAKKVAVVDDDAMVRPITAGTSERIRAALALACYAGLRLGELRALAWADVDFD